MKFTLSMLHEELIKRNYDVSSVIYHESPEQIPDDNVMKAYSSDGSNGFSSFRFCPAPREPEIDYLYISVQGERTSNLRHGPFSFNVTGADYPRICELVIDTCQYLNAWERDLYDMAWSGADYQEIIDRSDVIFGNPIFLCNWQGSVHGFSQAYKNAAFSPTWASITSTGRVPVSSLAALMDSAYSEFLSQENTAHFIEFKEHNHRSVFGLVHVSNEIVLQFQIIEHSRALTNADLDLAQVFLNALRLSFRNNDLSQHETALDVFRQLITGDDFSSDSVSWALDYLGWQDPAEDYNLLLLRQRTGSPCSEDLFAQVERHIPGSRVIKYKEDMVMFLPAALLKEFRKEVKYTVDVFNLYAGVSLPFSDWMLLRDSFSQAEAAYEHCSKAMPVSYGINYAWDFVLDSIEDKLAESGMLHPAVHILKDFDAVNGTEFARTLYTYLACERSNVRTASALFIHRNTLKYRLEKIEDLIDVDLDDFGTRMHLMLSLMAAS